MKANDLHTMTESQLETEISKRKKEQFNLRCQQATGQLQNTARIRIVRRDIAQMKTVLSQKSKDFAKTDKGE